MPTLPNAVLTCAIGLLFALNSPSAGHAQDSLPLRHKPSANRIEVAMGNLSSLEVNRAFTYAGGRRFILARSADAEQHLFVVADSARAVQQLVWIQVESRLPGQEGAYAYPDSTVNFHNRALHLNIRAYTAPPDPLSDRGSAYRIVERAGYRIPEGATRLRLVYLPEQPARREVMIIYLESNASSPAGMLSRAAAAVKILP